MSLAMRNKFAQQYANNYIETSVTEANPFRLVKLLYEAGIKNLSVAKVFIEQKNIEKKADHFNKVISILHGLKAGLDMKAGGEVAQNLMSLYDYMVMRTFQASAKNDLEVLDEVLTLFKDLNDAWDQLPIEYQSLTQEQLKKMRQQQVAQ